MATFNDDVLVWTFYFERPGKKLDPYRLGAWDQSMEESFGPAIDKACAKLQIDATKANRSRILALAVVTRGSDLSERVMNAAKFYQTVVDSEILS